MNLSYKQKSDIEFFIARVGKTKCGAILISYLIFPIFDMFKYYIELSIITGRYKAIKELAQEELNKHV